MHAWMGRRAIGHTAIGHTAPTPISHIAHTSHTPTWLKSHVHYDASAPTRRVMCQKSTPTRSDGHPPIPRRHPLSYYSMFIFRGKSTRFADLPICRSADRAHPDGRAGGGCYARDVRVRGCGCLGRRPRRRVRRPRRRVYDDDGRGITRVATDEVCRDAWTTYTTTTATARSPPSSSFVAHRPSDDVVVEHTHARTHIARTRV